MEKSNLNKTSRTKRFLTAAVLGGQLLAVPAAQASVPERVSIVRKALSTKLEAAALQRNSEAAGKELASWLNWTNWSNWNNWQNWVNWLNY